MEVITVNKQVPVYIDRPIDGMVAKNIPVSMKIEKAIPVQVKQDISTDRIVESSVEVLVTK